MKKIDEKTFIETIESLFDVGESLTADTDLSLYIKDSIDLGELMAVLKEKYDVTPQDIELFKKYTRLSDVLKIFNHEI